MNDAVSVIKRMFGINDIGEKNPDVFPDTTDGGHSPTSYFHPEVVHSLFGPTGTKETLVGRDAFLTFAQRCSEALSERQDEIIAITGIDEQCAFVHARAYRKSAASGQSINYEWAMLYRVENSLITYGADMLDADAQAFWGSVLSTPA
ncbi:hypothetical protein SAMN02927924_00935 [Sphingobium faniae]|nr:hypothetical protein SAMN02927924_00935 [Sphingobium faniae]